MAPRVLHVMPTFGFGGAERMVAGVISRARARGESPRLILSGGGAAERGMREELADFESIRLSHADAPNRADALRFGLSAWTKLRDAEVVHAHLPWPDRIGTSLLARGRRPALLTFHLLPAELFEDSDLAFPSRVKLATLLSGSAKIAPLVLVGVSRDDGARLRRAFPGLRVETVWNVPVPPPPSSDQGPLPFGPGLRIVTVGRMTAQKRFDRFLRALAIEPMKSRAFSLCMIGDGEERAALEALCRELGLEERVRFVGARVAGHDYRKADLFVTSSAFEGMPLALLEAMQAGLPVAASPIAPHREALEGVEEGLLPEDEAAWPSHLARLVDDAALRARIAEPGQRRALEHFSVEAQDAAYGALHRELAAQSQGWAR